MIMLDYNGDEHHHGTAPQTTMLEIFGSILWLIVNLASTYHMVMKNPLKDNFRLSQIMQYVLTTFNIYHLILLLSSFNNDNDNYTHNSSSSSFFDDHDHHGMVFLFQLAHSHLAYTYLKISSLFTGLVVLMILHELTIKKKKTNKSSTYKQPTTTSISTISTHNSPLSKRKTTKWRIIRNLYTHYGTTIVLLLSSWCNNSNLVPVLLPKPNLTLVHPLDNTKFIFCWAIFAECTVGLLNLYDLTNMKTIQLVLPLFLLSTISDIIIMNLL